MDTDGEEEETWMEDRDLNAGEIDSSSTIGKFWEVFEAAGWSGESTITWGIADIWRGGRGESREAGGAIVIWSWMDKSRSDSNDLLRR